MMKLYILLLWLIQFSVIAVALLAIFAFIGGWFIWEWGLFENDKKDTYGRFIIDHYKNIHGVDFSENKYHVGVEK